MRLPRELSEEVDKITGLILRVVRHMFDDYVGKTELDHSERNSAKHVVVRIEMNYGLCLEMGDGVGIGPGCKTALVPGIRRKDFAGLLVPKQAAGFASEILKKSVGGVKTEPNFFFWMSKIENDGLARILKSLDLRVGEAVIGMVNRVHAGQSVFVGYVLLNPDRDELCGGCVG